MQQRLNISNWCAASRMKGALRYHLVWMGKIVLWVLGILLASDLLSLLLPALSIANYEGGGTAVNFPATLLLALVCTQIAAGTGARFLTRFGTPRLSVWLSTLLSLFVMGAAFLLGTLVLSILSSYAALALSAVVPRIQLVSSVNGEALAGAALLSHTLAQALRDLPSLLLWTLEWICLFYLLSCCMRRNKWLTLGVLIGVPMVIWILLVFPAVRQTIVAVENASEGELMVIGMQWLRWLADAVRFVERNWQLVQGLAALVSLPLSYWCMRTTTQP
ncbi:MAG: hypothetical protein RSC91_00655 [Clostridia bacterium]